MDFSTKTRSQIAEFLLKESSVKIKEMSDEKLNDCSNAVKQLEKLLKKEGKELSENLSSFNEKVDNEIKFRQNEREKNSQENNDEKQENGKEDGIDISSGYNCPENLVKKEYSPNGKLKTISINTKNIPTIINSYTNFLKSLNAVPDLASSLDSLANTYSNFYKEVFEKNKTPQKDKEKLADNVIKDYQNVQNLLKDDVKIKSPASNSFFNSKIPDEVSFACLCCYIDAIEVKNKNKSNSYIVSKDEKGNLVVTNDKNQKMNIEEENSNGLYNRNSQDNSNEKDNNQPTEVRTLTGEELKRARDGLDNNPNENNNPNYKRKEKNTEQKMSEEDRANEAYLKELEENGMLGPTPPDD